MGYWKHLGHCRLSRRRKKLLFRDSSYPGAMRDRAQWVTWRREEAELSRYDPAYRRVYLPGGTSAGWPKARLARYPGTPKQYWAGIWDTMESLGGFESECSRPRWTRRKGKKRC